MRLALCCAQHLSLRCLLSAEVLPLRARSRERPCARPERPLLSAAWCPAIFFSPPQIGIVLAYFIAAASPNMDVANAVLPAYVTVLLFFGGFILDFSTMPQWWKWFSCARVRLSCR